jgi:hypothetical protein
MAVSFEPGSNITDSSFEAEANASVPIVSTLAGNEMATSETQLAKARSPLKPPGKARQRPPATYMNENLSNSEPGHRITGRKQRREERGMHGVHD